MEPLDDGVAYMDMMSWLLSPNEDLSDQGERMLDQLSELIVYLRLDLLDRLMTTLIHSERFWAIKVHPASKGEQVEAQQGSYTPIEPFRSIFLKLKFACLAKFQRSNLPQATPPPAHLPRLKGNDIEFIQRWRELVSGANHIAHENQSINLPLRQLCLISVIFLSTKPFHLSSSFGSNSRLKKLMQQDCIKYMQRSIVQEPSSRPSFAKTNLDSSSTFTWLAVQIVPSINPRNFAGSSLEGTIACLAKSLFQVFEGGNLFDQLSTSLDSTHNSLNLRPSSYAHNNLKRLSRDPLAQIVLSISLSISQLIENSSVIADLEAFQYHLTRLVEITQTIHETWRVATNSFNQSTLPKFEENSTSTNNDKNLMKTEENLIDRWLRNTFFCCLLIIGGLVNKLMTVNDYSDDILIKLLKPSFRVLYQIHFVALRLEPEQLSTHQAILDGLTLLSKPRKELANAILKEFQPSSINLQHIPNPVPISEIIFYLLLVEKFSGSSIEIVDLDQVVVPLIWTCLDNKSQIGMNTHLSLVKVFEFCSMETVLGLADKYFDLLIQGILDIDGSSVLNFDQQKMCWIALIKTVSQHSKAKTKELITKLVDMIKKSNPTRRPFKPTASSFNEMIKTKGDRKEQAVEDQGLEIRKKLYKLLISQIGEVTYYDAQSTTQQEVEALLDVCWDLILSQDDLIELFQVGLNQQFFKLGYPAQNLAVLWWLKKINTLNSVSISSKL